MKAGEDKTFIITIKAPIDCTDEEFKNWILFELGYRADLPGGNPLEDYPLEISKITVV